jgi:hypothetical protein
MKKISLCVIGTLLFFASNASANCSGQLVVKGQGDLDGISGCKTYSGSIKVDATNAAELRLNGVEVVSGDLQIGNNDGLVKLFLPNLQTVNGRMILNNNKLLASIDMPKVTAVNTFEITVHPALKMLKFPSKLKAVQRFNMGDTFATEIQGLAFSTAREVEVKNNIYLKQLQLGNVTVVESIQIYANSPALTIDVSFSFFLKKKKKKKKKYKTQNIELSLKIGRSACCRIP